MHHIEHPYLYFIVQSINESKLHESYIQDKRIKKCSWNPVFDTNNMTRDKSWFALMLIFFLRMLQVQVCLRNIWIKCDSLFPPDDCNRQKFQWYMYKNISSTVIFQQHCNINSTFVAEDRGWRVQRVLQTTTKWICCLLPSKSTHVIFWSDGPIGRTTLFVSILQNLHKWPFQKEVHMTVFWSATAMVKVGLGIETTWHRLWYVCFFNGLVEVRT